MADNNHLDFGAGKNKEGEAALEEENESLQEIIGNSRAWQAVRPEPREEGQDVQSYVQENVMKTGLIGAVTGFVIGAAAFVAKVVGTVVRNILWSERMQDAMASRAAKPAGKEGKGQEGKEEKKDGKDGGKGQDGESRENNGKEAVGEGAGSPGLMEKGKGLPIEKWGSVLSKHGATLTEKAALIETKPGHWAKAIVRQAHFRGKNGEAYTVDAKDLLDPKKTAGALWRQDGCGDKAASGIRAVLLAAELSNEGKSIDIPTPAGDLEFSVKMLGGGDCQVTAGGKDLFYSLPLGILCDQDAFKEAFHGDSLAGMAWRAAEAQASRTFTHEGFSFQQDLHGTITVAKDGAGGLFSMEVKTEEDARGFAGKLMENGMPEKAASGVVSFFRPALALAAEHSHGKHDGHGVAHMAPGDGKIYVRTPTRPHVVHDSSAKRTGPVHISRPLPEVREALGINLPAAAKAKNMPSESQFLTRYKGVELVVSHFGDGGLTVEPLKEGGYAEIKVKSLKNLGDERGLAAAIVQNSEEGKPTVLTSLANGECAKGIARDGKVYLTYVNCSLQWEMEERKLDIPHALGARQEDLDKFMSAYKEAYDEVKGCRGVAEGYVRPEPEVHVDPFAYEPPKGEQAPVAESNQGMEAEGQQAMPEDAISPEGDGTWDQAGYGMDGIPLGEDGMPPEAPLPEGSSYMDADEGFPPEEATPATGFPDDPYIPEEEEWLGF